MLFHATMLLSLSANVWNPRSLCVSERKGENVCGGAVTKGRGRGVSGRGATIEIPNTDAPAFDPPDLHPRFVNLCLWWVQEEGT